MGVGALAMEFVILELANIPGAAVKAVFALTHIPHKIPGRRARWQLAFG
jgi:hypothetical protein